MTEDLRPTTAGSSSTSSAATRAIELEELRKKQLTKQPQWQALDAAASASTSTESFSMDSWFHQQKQTTEQIRKQQTEAAQNLHKGSKAFVDDSSTKLKEQMRKKEHEATELLHSYRGQADVILKSRPASSSGGGSTTSSNDRMNVKPADVVAPAPGSSSYYNPSPGTISTSNNKYSTNTIMSSTGKTATTTTTTTATTTTTTTTTETTNKDRAVSLGSEWDMVTSDKDQLDAADAAAAIGTSSTTITNANNTTTTAMKNSNIKSSSSIGDGDTSDSFCMPSLADGEEEGRHDDQGNVVNSSSSSSLISNPIIMTTTPTSSINASSNTNHNYNHSETGSTTTDSYVFATDGLAASVNTIETLPPGDGSIATSTATSTVIENGIIMTEEGMKLNDAEDDDDREEGEEEVEKDAMSQKEQQETQEGEKEESLVEEERLENRIPVSHATPQPPKLSTIPQAAEPSSSPPPLLPTTTKTASPSTNTTTSKTVNVSIEFGLITRVEDSPPAGSFQTPIQCNTILDGLVNKIEKLAIQSLKLKNNHNSSNNSSSTAAGGGMKHVMSTTNPETFPILFTVMKDVSYKAPSNRPGVVRHSVKAKIPVKLSYQGGEESGGNGSNSYCAKSIIRGALRQAVTNGSLTTMAG